MTLLTLEGDGGTDLSGIVPNLNIKVLSVLDLTIKALKLDVHLHIGLIIPFELKVDS